MVSFDLLSAPFFVSGNFIATFLPVNLLCVHRDIVAAYVGSVFTTTASFSGKAEEGLYAQVSTNGPTSPSICIE